MYIINILAHMKCRNACKNLNKHEKARDLQVSAIKKV